MIKIFATGDNHIGMKFVNHASSDVLCERRIRAFEGMVEVANKENCGLFVITGDMFENNTQIQKADIKKLLAILSDFHGTVAVLPGNHDYYDADKKLWRDFNAELAVYDNVMLLTDYRPYRLTVCEDEVVLYPALCKSLHSEPGNNNLGWIKEENMPRDGAYRIGIAHGAVEGEALDREGSYFVMTRKELESIPVDVWLIGHTHVPFPRDLEENEYTAGGKIFNAGAHVQTDVSCNTDGECFIIEIDEDKTVRAKKYVSGNVLFVRRNVSVSAGGFERGLKDALADIPDEAVVDIFLKGAVDKDEYDEREDIIERVLARFIEGTYHDIELSKLITRELIETEFPETSFSAGLLKTLLDDPKEAQLAYELLMSVKEGK